MELVLLAALAIIVTPITVLLVTRSLAGIATQNAAELVQFVQQHDRAMAELADRNQLAQDDLVARLSGLVGFAQASQHELNKFQAQQQADWSERFGYEDEEGQDAPLPDEEDAQQAALFEQAELDARSGTHSAEELIEMAGGGDLDELSADV